MENNEQLTTIEWFVNRVESISNDKSLTKEESIRLYNQAIEHSKEMEKKQHELTALSMIEYALDNFEGKNNLSGKEAFEQYYNETYGDKKQ